MVIASGFWRRLCEQFGTSGRPARAAGGKRRRHAAALSRAIAEALEPRQYMTTVVYQDAFAESATLPGNNVKWSNNIRQMIPSTDPAYHPGQTANYFLGKLQGTETLTLSQLPEHYAFKVSFKLYLIGDKAPDEQTFYRSWANKWVVYPSGEGGPKFTLSHDSKTTDSKFTADWTDNSNGTPWSIYPDPAYSPSEGPFVYGQYGSTPVYAGDAARGVNSSIPDVDWSSTSGVSSDNLSHASYWWDYRNTLGYDMYGRSMNTSAAAKGNANPTYDIACGPQAQDAVYEVTFTFDHRETNLNLDFETDGGYFGIDDINVEMYTPARCRTCDDGVPQPGGPGAGVGGLKYSPRADIGPGEFTGTSEGGWWSGQPRMWETPEKKSVAVYDVNAQLHWFDKSGADYVPVTPEDHDYKLVHTGNQFVLTDPDGNTTTYWDFTGQGGPAGRYLNDILATLASSSNGSHYVPAGGYDAEGRVTTIETVYTSGTDTITEQTVTNRDSSGNVTWVALQRKLNSGNYATVERVNYTYYSGSEPYGGLAGDLKTAVYTRDGSTAVDTYYYRYFTTSTSDGKAHQIKYSFGPTAYTRLLAKYPTVTDASSLTDEQVAPYADDTFLYDVNGNQAERLETSVSADGSSTQVSINPDDQSADGPNTWKYKITTSAPSAGDTVTYQNYLHQTILSVSKDGTAEKSLTYYRYGADATASSYGHVTLIAHSSAFVVSGGKYYDESEPDLGLSGADSGGDSEYLDDAHGYFEFMAYGDATTAAIGTAGDVLGWETVRWIGQGELALENAAAIKQSQTTYIKIADGVFKVASETQYRGTGGTGGATTSYAYTYDGARVLSLTTTLPTVSEDQNGPGEASTTTVYDGFGRPQWTKDADGHITYTAYDLATGAVTKSIQDVKYSSLTSAEQGLFPVVWTQPANGLHLVTLYEVDALGRTTKMTDPNNSSSSTPASTYYLYDDVRHATYTVRAAAVSGGTLTPLAPIEMTRSQIPYTYSVNGTTYAGLYDETVTFSGTLSVVSGVPQSPAFKSTGNTNLLDLTAGGFTIQSLSRSVYDTAGRLAASTSYFSVDNSAYSGTSANSPYSGSEGTNYYKTLYGYDAAGRQNYVKSPTGTITRTVYDALGRVSSTWVGTDDTGATAGDPSNGGANNMKQVSATVYDNGGLGDGNVTQATQIPGGSPDRVTKYFYDWRDRQVAVKAASGVGEVTGDDTHFITFSDLNNLGEATAQYVYDGDGVTVGDGDGDGVPGKPAAGLLRAKSTTEYDAQGRAFRTTTYGVNPATGAVSSTGLVTSTWFDKRGNTIKTSGPGGQVSKMAYDGAGRVTASYVSDGGGDAAAGATGNWADAGALTGDAVLEQVEYAYDANGNVTMTTLRQRNAGETGTGALTGSTGRTSYSVSYYDAANRTVATVNVGTNAGSAYTRPPSVPGRTATALVTSFYYDGTGTFVEVTDPKNLKSRTYYDALGRKTKTIANYVDGTPGGTSADEDQTTLYEYDGAGHLTKLTADMPAGTDDQITEYVYGGFTSGVVFSNDLLRLVKYPSKTSAAASALAADQNSFTYNRLGQVISKTDQNGTRHDYTYDVLGRMTADAVTVASGNPQNVDTSVLLIATTYNTQGQASQITSYNSTSTSGTVVNQIQREYNGLGQLTKESQSHSGAVTSGTPSVQYGYSEMAGGVNHSRPTSLTYPNGRTVGFLYTDAGDVSGLSDRVSRLTAISTSTSSRGTSDANVIAGYTYLGTNTVVRRDSPQSSVRLDLWGGTAGTYTGLDAFSRISQQRWVNTSTNADVLNTAYGYDEDSNRTYAQDLVYGSGSNAYTYDGLNRLTVNKEGVLTAAKDDTSAGFFQNEESWTLDALGNATGKGSDETAAHVQTTYNNQNQLVTRKVKGNVANKGFNDLFTADTSANWTKVGGGDAFAVNPTGDPGYLDVTAVSQDTINGQQEGEARTVLLLAGEVGSIDALSTNFVVPSGTTSGQVGIVFGYKSAADYWTYVLDFADQYVKLYHVVNGSKGTAVVGGNTWGSGYSRSLALKTQGDQILSPFWIDIPGGMPSGKIGLYTSVTSGTTRFGDVSFWNTGARVDLTARWESYLPDTAQVQGAGMYDVIDPTIDKLRFGSWGSMNSEQPVLLKNLNLEKFEATFSLKYEGGSVGFIFGAQDARTFHRIGLQGDGTNVGVRAFRADGTELSAFSSSSSITSINTGDVVWVRVTSTGSSVTVKRIKSSSAPTESAWSSATDSVTYTGFGETGGRFGFNHSYGIVSVDDLTIKSDPDNNGSFDTTELVESFTLDSSGYDAGSDPAYDNNGNLIFDGTQAYTYDAWNRLVKVAHAYRDGSGALQRGSVFDTMAYDGTGRRVSQTVTGQGTAGNMAMHYYYSDAHQLLEERNSQGTFGQTLKQHVWGAQYVDELVQTGINADPADGSEQNAETFYAVLQDANFNVTGVVDAGGTLAERYDYDAYGGRTVYTSGGTNDPGLYAASGQGARVTVGGVPQAYGIMDFGHQGLLHDAATGLVYNRARYLSTELDRFVQQDPMGYVDGVNVYVGYGANPVTFIDAAGLAKGKAVRYIVDIATGARRATKTLSIAKIKAMQNLKKRLPGSAIFVELPTKREAEALAGRDAVLHSGHRGGPAHFHSETGGHGVIHFTWKGAASAGVAIAVFFVPPEADAALAIGNELDGAVVDNIRHQRNQIQHGIVDRTGGAFTLNEARELYPDTKIQTWEESKEACAAEEDEKQAEADVLEAYKYFGWAQYDMAQEQKYISWYKDRLRMGDARAAEYNLTELRRYHYQGEYNFKRGTELLAQ